MSNELTVVPPTDLMQLIQTAASDPAIDAAKLHSLLDFKIRLDRIDAEKAFGSALMLLLEDVAALTFTKDGKIPTKSGTIPFVSYEQIVKKTAPLLRKHGFTVRYLSDDQGATEQGVLWHMYVRHKDGHEEKSTKRLPPDPGPGRNNLQSHGSSDKYSKRYLIAGYLNITAVTDDFPDDDGNSAIKTITEAQISTLEDLLAEIAPDRADFLAYMKVARLSDIPAHAYTTAFEAVKSKRRSRGIK